MRKSAAQLARQARERLARASSVPPFDRWLPAVSPKYVWDWPFQRFIQSKLEAVAAGACRRLILNMPPRHGKTTLCTEHFAAWFLESRPDRRLIVCGHTQRLANKFSRNIRSLIRERVALNPERNASNEWETRAGGGLVSAGVGTALPGFGGHLILLDDFIRTPEEAESEIRRDAIAEWFDGLIYNRQEPNAAIIITVTRWHHDDLVGRLVREMEEGGERWEVINLPAIAEDDDPLGRASGEALCPDRFPVEELDKQRRKNPWKFEALFQQRPTPREGGLFQVDKIVTVAQDRVPKGLKWVRYWDLAQTVKKSSSFTAAAKMAFGPDGLLYVRDMFRRQLEWPELKAEMKREMLADPKVANGVEQALQGLSSVQEFKADADLRRAGVRIRSIQVREDKFTRALTFAERCNEGLVRFVEGAWIADCKSELAAFPRGKKNDQVDTLSGGERMLSPTHKNKGLYEF